MPLRRIAAALLAVAAFVAASAPEPQSPARDGLAQAITAELAPLADAQTATVHGAPIALSGVIGTFYARRGFRAAWNDGKSDAALRRALADSAADGLDPDDYYLPLLEDIAAQLRAPGATDALRAQYDILCTEALLRLGYHLSYGKVDAVDFDPEWNYARSPGALDVAQELEDALASTDLYAGIEALKPTHRLYRGLKQELARFRAAEAAPTAPVPPGPPLKPGAVDARVPVLRARLAASGDLAASASPDVATTYDPALEAAVRRYQARMGLAADGVVGPGTVAELNIPVAERIRQLRVNLDRGRVLLHDLPESFVVVNIAGYQAYFLRGQEVVWTARVQVGKPYRRTPLFRSEISYIVLNPTWTVPPGIIAADILPAAKRDPGAIAAKGLRVLDSGGHEVDPHSVDWSKYSRGIPYTLRQDPGPRNALGRVKLMFPNPYFVYLHDTPSQALFDRPDRAFSSGCVRVERALELAALVLADPDTWNERTIEEAIARGRTQNVTLKRRLPVLLAYWTAWVDSAGQTNFRRDLYGQDAKWAAALEAPFRLHATARVRSSS